MKFFSRLCLNVLLSGGWLLTHDNAELGNDWRQWGVLDMGLG